MAQQLTVFQRLNNLLTGISSGNYLDRTYKEYSLEKPIIKTTSKAEFEAAKLQYQQDKYLKNTYLKVESGLAQQSMMYETTRIGSYADYEAMEFFPEISAALDIMMEESTTVNNHGKMLNVYSGSDRVKGILEDLFFNRLDLHTSLPMWTRNVCKYGDNFLFLNVDSKNGIIGGRQMPNYEIDRHEGDLYENLIGNRSGKELDDVKFYWRGRDIQLNSWQIAHFRLLGDDRRLPYGTCLKGDTRINTEFGVEEIKDIKIGTKVWSFNTETQEKELSPILDKVMSGTKEVFKISTRHNFIDASKEHRILVATEDGEFIYKNVSDLKLGDLLVLNKNEHTNKKIKIDKSKPLENKNGWFNNIDSIPDFVTEEFAQLFGFLIGDGWLTSNNSKVEFALSTDDETNQYYIGLLEKFSGKEVICYDKQASLNSKLLKTILTRMGFSGKSYEKRIPNWVFEMELDYQKAFVSGLMDADGWATRDQWVIALHIELNNKPLIEDLKILLQRIGYKSGSIRSRIRKNPIIEGREIKTVKESHLITFFDSYLFQMKKYEFKNRKTDNFVLEPIQSIESIGEYETYDIYVENDNHNFYANNIVVHNSILEKARRIWRQLLLSEDSMLVYRVTRAPERRVFKIYVGNIDTDDVEPYINAIANRFKRSPIIDPKTGQIDLRYNQLANDQDYFIPVRDESAPNPIDTLPGACIALDTCIPLLDGRTLELQEIIKEWNNGNRDLWVYSCNPETGELAPGMITWAGETRKDAEVMKITLDNGESITTTPDHKWVHRTKGFVEAKDLVVGDSLMPFYTKESKIRDSKSTYKQTWDSSKQRWVYDHRLVANYFKNINEHNEFVYDIKYINEDKRTIHHVNINRYDNRPNNLTFMNNEDHYIYHSDNFGKNFSYIGGLALKDKLNTNIDFRNKFIQKRKNLSLNMWANRSEEDKKDIAKKQSIGIINYINNLSENERLDRLSKLITPEARKKATLTYKNNPNRGEILKNSGLKISKTKSSEKFKSRVSEISKNLWLSEEYKNKVFSKKQKITFTDELYNMFFEMFKLYGKADLTLDGLNKNDYFMNEFISSNNHIRSSLTNLDRFTHNHLDKMLKERGFNNYIEWCKVTAEELGYKNVRAWRYFIKKNKLSEVEFNYNHKIINIEWLSERQNTGTITVDGDERYHNYHTFATKAGVFIKNSNLDAIADIEYLQNKLFTALRVPKPFLGFDAEVGGGKNLALEDIRFSRTINRIQQSMLQELNKIAIIHLFLLGFEDELNNFSLTLNNPSIQAEILKIEHMQNKINLYKDSVTDPGNGFAAMSMTRAKREILGWSDKEIKQDLLEQRIEKAAAAEIENTTKVIKHTGIFDDLDLKYGDINVVLAGDTVSGEGDEGETDTDTGIGSFGGGSSSSFDGGFDEEPAEEPTEEPTEEPAELSENVKKYTKLLKEEYDKKRVKYNKLYLDRLIESYDGTNELEQQKFLLDKKQTKITHDINKIINNIDDLTV